MRTNFPVLVSASVCAVMDCLAGGGAMAAERAASKRGPSADGLGVMARAATSPVCVSGVYPHLTALGGRGDEFGIGVLVPWAGKLWMKTYSSDGPGNFYSIDDALTLRLEGKGQGLGNRLVHLLQLSGLQAVRG